ncbi:hypothetical protein ACIQB5_51680, partial [Streptomyces sp. NPDC088560]
SGMPGNWPVPFGKGPSEKDPNHGHLVGGLLHSAGGRAEQDLPRRAPHRAADPTGWIMMHRRLARDYEAKPAHSESMIRLAMISNLAKRATGETVITWRKP